MPDGQLILHLLDALVDELAREIDVGAVLEHDRDLAQPVARERARIGELRQAAHRGLDRKRDALLDLERRIARRAGVDLHLHVGDVRHGVDRQAREIVGAEGREAEHHEDHQPSLLDREGENGIDHGSVLMRRRGLADLGLDHE